MDECVMYIFSFSAGEKKLYNMGILILDGSSKKKKGEAATSPFTCSW